MAISVLLEEESSKAAFAQASILAVSPSSEPVSLDEAKEQLRVVVDDDDAYIQRLISAARSTLENLTNRALVPQTVKFTTTHFYDGMKLPRVPVVGDLQISYADGDGALVALEPAGFVLTDDEPPRLYPARGLRFPEVTPWHGAVRVEYTAGYGSPDEVPESLKQWILLAVTTFYEQRSSIVVGASVAELPADFMQSLWQYYRVYV